MFQFPGFAFVPYVFRHKYLLLISANPKSRLVKALALSDTGASELQISKVGFPIRKFTDQSLFAAPHDLSQRTTSFIASQRQGIHRMPLRHLIALIIDAHRSAVAVSHSLLNANDTSIERPFASNASENVAVKQTSTCWYARRRPRSSICDRHTIGCISSSRCRITRQAHCCSPQAVCRTRLLDVRALRRSMRRWWSQTGSNRRPHACKARALPTELWPRAERVLVPRMRSHLRWWAWEDLNFRPHAYQARALTN